MSTNRENVFWSLIWKCLEKGSYQVILFIVTLILARLLTPEDYGTVAIVLVIISLATVFVEGGLNTALIQKTDTTQEDYSTIFYFSILVAFIAYVLLWFFSPAISLFYNKVELITIIRVLGFNLFFNAINSIQRAYLSKHLLFKKLFLSSTIGVVFSAIIGIWMAYSNYGIWALVSQQLSMSFIVTVVMWYTVNWRPTLVISKDSFHELFSFGWKIFVTNLTISLFVNIRSLIIGKFFTSSSLAYFDKGKQFPSLIMDNVNSAIQQVMFPVLSNEQNDVCKVRDMVKISTTVSSFVIYPLLVMLAVMAKPLTIILLTERWINIVPFIQIFCIANLFMPIQNVNMEAIKSLGYSNITLKLEIIKKIIEITILVVSLFFGVLAVAWGVAIYNLISVFINLWPCSKLYGYGLQKQLKDNMSSVLTTLFMLCCIFWIPAYISNYYLQIILISIIGTISFIFISSIIKVTPYTYILKLIKNRMS